LKKHKGLKYPAWCQVALPDEIFTNYSEFLIPNFDFLLEFEEEQTIMVSPGLLGDTIKSNKKSNFSLNQKYSFKKKLRRKKTN